MDLNLLLPHDDHCAPRMEKGAPCLCSPRWRIAELEEYLQHRLARIAELEAEVARLTAQLESVRGALRANGCDCECDHHPEEHEDECARCLACRISFAVGQQRADEARRDG